MGNDTAYTSFFKLSDEPAFGTYTAPTDDVLLLDAIGEISENQNISEEVGTGSRLVNQTIYNQYDIGGSLSGKLQGGRLIAYALGIDTMTGSGIPYTHTMTQSDTTPLTSFTLGKYGINTDIGQEATGCKINDFSLNLDVNGVLNSTFNFLGKQSAKKTSTVGTRTQSTCNVVSSYMCAVTWNASEIATTSFSFNYSNNLGSDEYDLGDRRRQDITEGGVSMSGNFILVFANNTVYDDFQSDWSTGVEVGTQRALVFTADNGLISTSERGMTITMANVGLNTAGNSITLDNKRVVQNYSYTPETLTNIVVKDNVSVDYISGD